MYDLYIANKNYSSWSLRPWVLLSELGIPFREHLVAFEEGSSWERFRKFSPTGKVPCLIDEGTVVWESLSIAEYLAERHEGVWPKDGKARAWARSAASEMHAGFTALRGGCPMNIGIRVQLREIGAELRRDLDRLSELWNEGLSRFGGPFLAGKSFTAVDAFFAPVAFRIQTYGLALDEASLAYATRLRELPSVRRWYEAGLAETWRPKDHEDGVGSNGVLVEDLRAKA
ncbi:glutathione S-transferase family protein [Pendulispora brunnea]|uniref:Glutathione S-transferase family protein n=1 Tax=Pendulispora brunnea TaxID=2905690 RepID=A0ABZ2K4G9_9BACT